MGRIRTHSRYEFRQLNFQSQSASHCCSLTQLRDRALVIPRYVHKLLYIHTYGTCLASKVSLEGV